MSDELQTYIEPELEARLVAWVLGEASAFEAEELERLISERPELKACKERLEKIHGVLVAAHQKGTKDEWKLSKERREKILAKGEMARQEKVWRDELKRSRQRARRNRRRKVVMLCAACVVMGLLLMISTPLVLRSPKSAHSMRDKGDAAEAALAALDEEIMAQSDLVREKQKELRTMIQEYGIPYFESGNSTPFGMSESGMLGSARGKLDQLQVEVDQLESGVEALKEKGIGGEPLESAEAKLELTRRLTEGLEERLAQKQAATIDLSLDESRYSRAREDYEMSRQKLRELQIARAGVREDGGRPSSGNVAAQDRSLSLYGEEEVPDATGATDKNPFEGDGGRKEQIAAALADLDAAMVEHRESAGEQDRSRGGVVDGKASPPRAIVIEDSAEMNEPALAASVPVSPSSRPVRSQVIASNGVVPAPTTGPVAGKPGQAGQLEKKVAEQLQREVERVEAKSAKLESPGEPAGKEQMTRKKEAGPVAARASRAITVDEMAQDDDYGAEGYFGKDAVPEEMAKGGEVPPVPTAKPAPAMEQPRSETIAGRALSEKTVGGTNSNRSWQMNTEGTVAEAEELGVNNDLASRLEKELSLNLSREDGKPSSGRDFEGWLPTPESLNLSREDGKPSAQQQRGEQGLGETRERFAQTLNRKQNAPKGRVAGGFLAEEADRFWSDSEVKPGKGRSADFEVGRESAFDGGGMGGGGAEQTNRDFIDPVDRVEIPGIPPAPQDKVRGIVTAGNRSGLDGLENAIVENDGDGARTTGQSRPVEAIVAASQQAKAKEEAKKANEEAEKKRRLERENFETPTAEKSDSTFSLNVSDVSFKLAKSALAEGKRPEVATVRAEEFVNALDYGDDRPTQAEKVSCEFEQGAHPFLSQRNLLRLSMSTASLGRNAGTPLRLTLLLDQSGSMERADRVESLKRAFALLSAQLNANDEVTLIGFARTPRLLAERVKGNEVAKLAEIIANPITEGGTNLEEALSTGIQLAKQQFLKGAQNRVILLTDGAANLGDAKPETLAMQVESMRKAGIAFDACGVGADGLNDEVLSSLAKKGDGRYYFLDRPEDADEGFARQIAGALRPAAKNVKVQVLFNPERVTSFKLYGFEKHQLKKEDFRNDKVDAAEMAAEESGVALYHFEPNPEGRGDVGTVSVRFLDTASNEMVERTWLIPYEPQVAFFNKADPRLRLAGVAGLFAERLKGSAVGERVELKRLRQELLDLKARFGNQPRVHELETMLRQAGE